MQQTNLTNYHTSRYHGSSNIRWNAFACVGILSYVKDRVQVMQQNRKLSKFVLPLGLFATGVLAIGSGISLYFIYRHNMLVCAGNEIPSSCPAFNPIPLSILVIIGLVFFSLAYYFRPKSHQPKFDKEKSEKEEKLEGFE